MILFLFTHSSPGSRWSSSAATRSGSTTSTPASIRFAVRVYAWVYLQTDDWPPFGLGDDPTYPIRVNIAAAAERQSRLKALFRLILALPMLIVSYAVNYIHLCSRSSPG